MFKVKIWFSVGAIHNALLHRNKERGGALTIRRQDFEGRKLAKKNFLRHALHVFVQIRIVSYDTNYNHAYTTHIYIYIYQAPEVVGTLCMVNCFPSLIVLLIPLYRVVCSMRNVIASSTLQRLFCPLFCTCLYAPPKPVKVTEKMKAKHFIYKKKTRKKQRIWQQQSNTPLWLLLPPTTFINAWW